MPEHYTKNTFSAQLFCPKCCRFTQHRIDGGRKGPCLRCIELLEKQHAARREPPAKQESLF